MMLLAETFLTLLQMWDSGQLNAVEPHLVRNRVPQALIQIAKQTLLCQKRDGTWCADFSPERDAYAILTLLAMTSLPHVKLFELIISVGDPKWPSCVAPIRKSMARTAVPVD